MATTNRNDIAHAVATMFVHALGTKDAVVRYPQGYDSDDQALFKHSYTQVRGLHMMNIYAVPAVAIAAHTQGASNNDILHGIANVSLSTWAKRMDGTTKLHADVYKSLQTHVQVIPAGTPTLARPIAAPVQANPTATIAAAIAHGADPRTAQAALPTVVQTPSSLQAMATSLQTSLPASPEGKATGFKGLTWPQAKALGAAYFSWQHDNDIPVGSDKSTTAILFGKANPLFTHPNGATLKAVEPVAIGEVLDTSTAIATVPATSLSVDSQTTIASVAGLLMQAAKMLMAISQPEPVATAPVNITPPAAPTPAAPTPTAPTLQVSQTLTAAEQKALKAIANAKARAAHDAKVARAAQDELLTLLAGAEVSQPVTITLTQRIKAAQESGVNMGNLLGELRGEGYTMVQLQDAVQAVLK